MKPAIVIVAFNRPYSLERILKSINRAYYRHKNITLCISIDYEKSRAHKKVVDIAKRYKWRQGTKRIIRHDKNIGLKQHVLACGDLTRKYGSIIVLEDDLYVSPNFYSYAANALDFYEKEDKIGGISLYNHQINFNNVLPFEPIADEGDVYFMKIASSWGQAWTKRQWSAFVDWYQAHQTIPEEAFLPQTVIDWPDSSWLKHFIHYLGSTDKYFVYPRYSLTTNFSDAGTHNTKKNSRYQVPLEVSRKNYKFINLDESLAKYDPFFELEQETFKHFVPSLSNYDFEADLYGSKPLDKIKKEYLLTSKENSSSLLSFGLRLKPFVMNIFDGVEGHFFCLAEKSLCQKKSRFHGYDKNVFSYLYGNISLRSKIKNVLSLLYSKMKRHV